LSGAEVFPVGLEPDAQGMGARHAGSLPVQGEGMGTEIPGARRRR